MSVKENIITLGIESSCDETSVAVVKMAEKFFPML